MRKELWIIGPPRLSSCQSLHYPEGFFPGLTHKKCSWRNKVDNDNLIEVRVMSHPNFHAAFGDKIKSLVFKPEINWRR